MLDCAGESEVASWERDTAVRPPLGALRTWLGHSDRTPKARRTRVGCFSYMDQEAPRQSALHAWSPPITKQSQETRPGRAPFSVALISTAWTWLLPVPDLPSPWSKDEFRYTEERWEVGVGEQPVGPQQEVWGAQHTPLLCWSYARNTCGHS